MAQDLTVQRVQGPRNQGDEFPDIRDQPPATLVIYENLDFSFLGDGVTTYEQVYQRVFDRAPDLNKWAAAQGFKDAEAGASGALSMQQPPKAPVPEKMQIDVSAMTLKAAIRGILDRVGLEGMRQMVANADSAIGGATVYSGGAKTQGRTLPLHEPDPR
jgi:hypothetical protein